MNIHKPLGLAAITALALFLAVPGARLSATEVQDTGHRHMPPPGKSLHYGLMRKCQPRRSGDPLSAACLRAVLQHPLVRQQLDRVPALQDGRLSVELLLNNALRARFVPPPEFPDDGDPGEIAAREHLADDGRTLRFLTREEIAELEDGVGFAVEPLHLAPRFGPSELQNWPPVPPPDPFPLPGPGLIPPPPDPDNLNIGEFLTDMHAALAANVNGYALRIRREGETVGVLQWNWARNPNLGDVPGLGWNSSRRMHVASISKFMTAIGLAHLLENSGGLDADDAVWPWLPAYWNRTAGANEFITFDRLMDHRSGFSTGGSASDWQTMKNNVEAGVQFADIGDFDYENMNFGLIRILTATIGGYIDPDTDFGFDFINDIVWDAITWAAYNDYMQTYVFNPVGAYPVIDSNVQSVLGYRYDGTGPGWDSGNFAGSAGGVGWRMTVNEILDVTRALRKGQLVGIGSFADIINRSWGLNSPLGGETTDAGNIYYKAGRWTTNVNNPATARTEQCFVLFQPTKQIEVVVFVNSEVGASGVSLTNLVRTAFVNNIEGP
jgi:CubicO group peptidase (beta-lactamase class C family)